MGFDRLGLLEFHSVGSSKGISRASPGTQDPRYRVAVPSVHHVAPAVHPLFRRLLFCRKYGSTVTLLVMESC